MKTTKIDLLFFVIYANFAWIFYLYDAWQVNFYWCVYTFYCIVGVNLVALSLGLTGEFSGANLVITIILANKLSHVVKDADIQIGLVIFSSIGFMGVLMGIVKKLSEKESDASSSQTLKGDSEQTRNEQTRKLE